MSLDFTPQSVLLPFLATNRRELDQFSDKKTKTQQTEQTNKKTNNSSLHMVQREKSDISGFSEFQFSTLIRKHFSPPLSLFLSPSLSPSLSLFLFLSLPIWKCGRGINKARNFLSDRHRYFILCPSVSDLLFPISYQKESQGLSENWFNCSPNPSPIKLYVLNLSNLEVTGDLESKAYMCSSQMSQFSLPENSVLSHRQLTNNKMVVFPHLPRSFIDRVFKRQS